MLLKSYLQHRTLLVIWRVVTMFYAAYVTFFVVHVLSDFLCSFQYPFLFPVSKCRSVNMKKFAYFWSNIVLIGFCEILVFNFFVKFVKPLSNNSFEFFYSRNVQCFFNRMSFEFFKNSIIVVQNVFPNT